MEVGPRDVKNNQVVLVRRDNGQKITEKSDGLVNRIEVQQSQHAERDLNEIEKIFNWTLVGGKSMYQGLRKYFV